MTARDWCFFDNIDVRVRPTIESNDELQVAVEQVDPDFVVFTDGSLKALDRKAQAEEEFGLNGARSRGARRTKKHRGQNARQSNKATGAAYVIQVKVAPGRYALLAEGAVPAEAASCSHHTEEVAIAAGLRRLHPFLVYEKQHGGAAHPKIFLATDSQSSLATLDAAHDSDNEFDEAMIKAANAVAETRSRPRGHPSERAGRRACGRAGSQGGGGRR